jgi:hypothetical protein
MAGEHGGHSTNHQRIRRQSIFVSEPAIIISTWLQPRPSFPAHGYSHGHHFQHTAKASAGNLSKCTAAAARVCGGQ